MSSEIQFFVNEAGEKTAVVLPVKRYEMIRRMLNLRVNEGFEQFDGLYDARRRLTALEAAMIGAGLAQSHPQRVSGAVCFVEAPRLQIEILFGNLDEGESVEDFLENYPDTISPETIEKSMAVRQRILEIATARDDISNFSHWRELLTSALCEHGETWADVEFNTLSSWQLDREFDRECERGGGEPFTMWTDKRIYFPIVRSRDCVTCVGSVPREPSQEPTCHIGA